ncbi:MAG: hypothetical protein LBC49_05800, partial [Bacteroidales bacterium]|nr:hypothetical protein [Bacteroidales bacterium]
AEYEKIKNVTSTDKRLYKVIPVAGANSASDDFLQTILSIRSALSHAEMVSFQGDRFIDGQPTFNADFLGYSATFPAGVFTVARKMRVPVVFLFVMRQRKFTYKIEFVFVNAADCSDDRSNDRLGDGFRGGRSGSENEFKGASGNEPLEKKYISALENIVRRYPQQWFNFYKFWN